MRARFDDLIARGATAVRELMGEPEELDFDCKRKRNPNVGEPDKEDKETLGKMLSAFSNSMGGLLLWGVDARPNSVGIDCIQGFEPISNIGLFEARMKALAVEALMPRISDVQIEAIEDPPGSNKGFLAVYIDRSERRPHQCEFGHKAYYRRAGSSSRQMEHFEVEDAFKRVMVPTLEASCEVYLAGSRLGATDIGISLTLTNSSNVSAMYPYVMVDLPHPFDVDGYRRTSGINQRQHGATRCFEGESGTAIHPGVVRPMAMLKLTVPTTHKPPSDLVIERHHLTNRMLKVRYGCRDLRMQEKVLEFSPDFLIAGVPNGHLVF